MIFRAALGFAIALTVLHGRAGWTASPALSAAKADIAAQHPQARLNSLIDEGVSMLAARICTVGNEIRRAPRARRLHS